MTVADRQRAIHAVLTVPSVGRYYGGPARSVTGLALALAASGVVVDLFAGTDDRWGPMVAGADRLGARLHRVRARGPHGLRVYPGLPRAMTDVVATAPSDTIVHANGLWTHDTRAAAVVARRSGTPLVISPRGMLEPWALTRSRIRKRLAMALYQRRDLERAALLCATSTSEAEGLRRIGLRAPIAVIPNGIDVAPAAVTQARAADRAAGAGGARTALFLGRLHPKKGLLNLLEAWARVAPPGWRLVIAGPDQQNHRAAVETAIHRGGLQHAVSCVGEADGAAKHALFAAAEVFVLPSFSENFGIVVAEAMAHGLPVIATTGTPWQLLVEHDCGWWVPPTVDGIADALRSATSMPAARLVAMGARGRRVSGQWRWQRVAPRLADCYRWLLRGGPRPAAILDER
ncbi:MAG: glycosyltransferase [Gammaproteobacteria bacterium]|nr:glycosyltransferase [Gammaproteobacteria bacterium]